MQCNVYAILGAKYILFGVQNMCYWGCKIYAIWGAKFTVFWVQNKCYFGCNMYAILGDFTPKLTTGSMTKNDVDGSVLHTASLKYF